MSKQATITPTEIAADVCRQLALTGLAPTLSDLCADATRRRISHPAFLTEALQVELDIGHERRRGQTRSAPWGQSSRRTRPGPFLGSFGLFAGGSAGLAVGW